MNEEIREELSRLKYHIDGFDNGKQILAKDIANVVALICHTQKSTSLLDILPIKKEEILFPVSKEKLSFSYPFSYPFREIVINLCSLRFFNSKKYLLDRKSFLLEIKNSSIVGDAIAMENTGADCGKFISTYERKNPGKIEIRQSFEDWWDKEVILCIEEKEWKKCLLLVKETHILQSRKFSFTRKDIILLIRDKDGGTHHATEKDKEGDNYKKFLKGKEYLENNDKFGIKRTDGEAIKLEYSGIYTIARSIASELIISLEHYLGEEIST